MRAGVLFAIKTKRKFPVHLLACSFILFFILPAKKGLAGIVYSSQSSSTFPVPTTATRIVMGDFDNDGDADILYQTGGNGTAFQYARSNGDGTFSILAQSSSPFAGLTLPDNLGNTYKSGDFDGDGDIDVWAAVASTGGSYFRNDGGSFSSQSTSTFPAPLAPTRVAVGDFDSDGDADILYQTAGNGTAFQYARSNANGTFTIVAQSSSPFAGLTLPDNLGNTYKAGDFDGDGDIDVWAPVASTGGSYFRNDGSSFSSQSTSTFPAPLAPTRVAIGDFDSDGDADILYQTSGNGTAFQYARSNGDGTFTIVAQSSSPFAGLTLPDNLGNSYYVGDVDNDADPDVWSTVASATGTYLRQDGRPPYIASSTPADNATNFFGDANLSITFNETVSKGTGNIYIVRTSDNAVVQSIPVTGAQVTGSGTSWTINPPSNLAVSTAYAMRFDRKIFADVDGAIFQGITNNTSFNFTTAATLPVSLVNFTGYPYNGQVVLQWQTAIEQNSSQFVIERSADGSHFGGIGTLAATGNSNSLRSYHFNDRVPLQGLGYYRLKETDMDGVNNYSGVIMVQMAGTAALFSVLQNPVTDGRIGFVINAGANERYIVSLYSMAGTEVYNAAATAGANYVPVKGWPGGVYLLILRRGKVQVAGIRIFNHRQ